MAIADGLVYAAGFDGRLHCLDAETGKCLWVHEAGGQVWGSPLVADGKVYLGSGKKILWVLAAGQELKVLNRIRMHDAVTPLPPPPTACCTSSPTGICMRWEGKARGLPLCRVFESPPPY